MKTRSMSFWKHIVVLVLISIVSVGILLGCGGEDSAQQSVSTTTAKADNPMTMLPQGALMVAGMNVDIYRTPETMKEYEDALKINPQMKQQLDEIKNLTGLDVLKDLDKIGIAVYLKDPAGEEVPSVAAAASGNFDETKIVAAINSKSPTKLQEGNYSGVKYYFGDMEGTTVYMVFPKSKIIMASNDKAIFDQMIDRSKSSLPSVMNDPQLKEAMAEVKSNSPFWLSGMVPPTALASMQNDPQTAFLAGVKSYYFYVNETAAKGSHIEIGTICSDAAAAESVKTGVQNLLNQIRPMAMMFTGDTFNVIFDKASVTSSGKIAKIVIELTKTEIEELQKKMEAFAQQNAQIMQQMQPPQ